jgi:hypothetical protein
MRNVRRVLLVFLAGCLLASAVKAEFTFYLIDNFEGGKADKWYRFGNLEMSVVKNPSVEAGGQDTIADSCGDYSLQLKGKATGWYAGGIGTDICADARPFSRFQMDVYGSGTGGKIRIELFDYDNGSHTQEAASGKKNGKWVAEAPILRQGFTRVSIPFSAFKPDPGPDESIWDPKQDGSGGLLKVQFVLLTDQAIGEVAADIDNILLTY